MGPPSRKRKVVTPKVDEINFDASAREQFLTGFRKRKLQRAKHAQSVAEEKLREAKREHRKQLREDRNSEFERALQEHKKQLKRLREENSDTDGSNSEGDDDEDQDQEWDGFEEPPAVDYEAEYIDEDKYTTVTVEEMDPSREGLLKSQHEDDSDEDEQAKPAPQAVSKPEKTKKKASDNKPKKKKKKFRYESKEDRKLTRTKQRLSNKKKADARRER